MSFLSSPIPSSSGRELNVGPVPFRRYYYEQPVAGKLLSSEVGELAADIYSHYRADPISLLLLVRGTRWIYTGPTDPHLVHGLSADRKGGPPIARLNIEYQPHYKMLGSILADIGRKLSAGLTGEEIRSIYRLSKSPVSESSAKAKLEKQEQDEGRWYMAAVGG